MSESYRSRGTFENIPEDDLFSLRREGSLVVPPMQSGTDESTGDQADEAAQTAQSFPVLDIPHDVLAAVVDRAEYEPLPDEGSWYASIPDDAFRGVWAKGQSQSGARLQLESALREWLSFRIWRNKSLPDVPGLDIHALTGR